jgi:hypothetical protein
VAKGLVTLQILTPPLVGAASADVRRQGASINGAQSGKAPFSVTTTGIGALVAGDKVVVGTGDEQFTVVSAAVNTVVLGGFDYRLSLANGARLSLVNTRPALYADEAGITPLLNPILLFPNVGYKIYATPGQYDILEASGGGRALRTDVTVGALPDIAYEGAVLTIADHTITVSAPWHRINSTDAAELWTITPAASGTRVVLSVTLDNSNIAIINGNGNIQSGLDFTFDHAGDRIYLMCDGVNWQKVAPGSHSVA